jgi:hypothetical protein
MIILGQAVLILGVKLEDPIGAAQGDPVSTL